MPTNGFCLDDDGVAVRLLVLDLSAVCGQGCALVADVARLDSAGPFSPSFSETLMACSSPVVILADSTWLSLIAWTTWPVSTVL